MLNSIKTLKRYDRILMMTTFFYLYDRFFDTNQNFTTEHVKIPVFISFFSKFPKFQVFPGKVATLDVTKPKQK